MHSHRLRRPFDNRKGKGGRSVRSWVCTICNGATSEGILPPLEVVQNAQEINRIACTPYYMPHTPSAHCTDTIPPGDVFRLCLDEAENRKSSIDFYTTGRSLCYHVAALDGKSEQIGGNTFSVLSELKSTKSRKGNREET